MKRSVRESLPSMKAAVITIGVCLAIGVLIAGGLHPNALFGLVLAAIFLLLQTIRNTDPNGFQAVANPEAYSLRVQRDRLATSLEALTKAAESTNTPDPTLATRAQEAREVLASLK